MSVKAQLQKTEVKSYRNFKMSPDIEAFYRFVYENDFRHEASLALTAIVNCMKSKRKTRKKRGRKKLQ